MGVDRFKMGQFVRQILEFLYAFTRMVEMGQLPKVPS